MSFTKTVHPPSWNKAKDNGDRWWFRIVTDYTSAHNPPSSVPKPHTRLVATVTRDAKWDSPTFNRWFVSFFGHAPESFATLSDAKAWVQAIWRLQ